MFLNRIFNLEFLFDCFRQTIILQRRSRKYPTIPVRYACGRSLEVVVLNHTVQKGKGKLISVA